MVLLSILIAMVSTYTLWKKMSIFLSEVVYYTEKSLVCGLLCRIAFSIDFFVYDFFSL